MTALTPLQLTFRRDLADSRKMLWRSALALTRDPQAADDLVQDTVERALRFEHTYQPGSNFQGWLGRVMHNVFNSHCRRSKVEVRVLKQLALAEQDRQQAPKQPWFSRRVAKALNNLPDKIGDVVYLVDLQDMTYGDAAGVLNVPVGTIMSRLHRGRRRLAERLQDRENVNQMTRAA